MIKTPHNSNIPQKILYSSGKKAMGFRKANDASDTEVRREGAKAVGKAIRIVVGKTAIAGLLVGGTVVAVNSMSEAPTVGPTVKIFDARPKAFPDYEKITVQPGDTAWDIAEDTQPNSDPRRVSVELSNQDVANEADGVGHKGFDAGDPLIVRIPSTDK